MDGRSIKQAALELGISEHTLRFYEKAGIIASVERNSSGYRSYSRRDLEMLKFAMRLRATAMPLEQIKNYLHLVRENTQPETRLHLLLEHLERIQASIQALEEAKTLLEYKVGFYHKTLALPVSQGERHE